MNKKYLGRYRTIACVVALLFGVLITRLFNLQIAGYDDNLSSAESKKTKTITSQGSRGTIMDVNSLTLAYDKQIYNVQFYRDPNYTPTDIDETTGKTISQYKVYTNAIINVIDIIEKNGGTLNTSFSLVQDEMTGLWVFTWNNNKYTQAQQDAREKMWRSNFYVSSTTAYPQQQLFEKLCSKYRIPEELSTEKKIQVLSVWETMQNNAFLSQPITIASNVSWETVIEIEAKALTMEGISVSVSTQRVYPNGTLACHVVGYIGKIQNYDTYYTSYKDKGYALSDLIGLDGVEKTMEDWLSACTTQRVGKRVVEIDRYGAVSRTLSSTEATDGNNIKLTIDSNLQRVAENALEENINYIRDQQETLLNSDSWLDKNKADLQGTTRDFETNPIELAEKGAVVVIDMEGRVLALASYPPYDPNAFIVGGDAAANILLDSRNPLVNYAIGSRDTPGSIFKLVTSATALEKSASAQTETHTCTGKTIIGGQEIICMSSHGTLAMPEALAHSCNVAFGELAAELGAGVLQEYAEKLGLTGSISCEGYKTAPGKIDLSGADDGDVAWAGIGQYTDQVGALAFLRYMGAIANGGSAAEPYLMQRVRKGDDITYEAETKLTSAMIQPETAGTLTKLMRNDVQTIYGDWQFGGLSVCAKSGTAEREGQTANAMFAGFVLDASCPVAFVVFVENGGAGSTVAAPMAAKVLGVCAQVLQSE